MSGLKARPLVIGLVTAAALLLTFIICVAIFGWLGGDVQFSNSLLIFAAVFIDGASYAIGATAHTLTMTPRDVYALAPALALDEESIAREAIRITDQSSAIHIWTLCCALAAVGVTWWTAQMAAIEDDAMAKEMFQPAKAGWPDVRNLLYVV